MAWASIATTAGIVALTGISGIAGSFALASIGGAIAALAALFWIRRKPVEEIASRAPRAVRIAFLAGTLLVAVQLAWLVPFILDPSRSTWGPGLTAALASSHSCVSAYWVADDAAPRVPDIYDESLASLPQRDPKARRVPRSIGPLNLDPFEYPPTFLVATRLLRTVAPDFWSFRQLWFALNFGVVLWIAVALALRLDRAAQTHAVWLVPFVIAAPPIVSTFQAGNVQMAVIAASVYALLLFERRAYVAGGLLLAYVVAAKIYPGVLVLYLLLRRDWRAVAWTAACGVVLVAASLAMLGWTPFAAFIDHAPKLMSGEAFPAFRNPSAVAINGSIPGIVFKLGLIGVPHMGLEAMRLVGWLYTPVVIGATFWLALRARPLGREPLVWMAILVFATMRSPFLPAYAAFPTSWLITFAAALAWRDRRPVWPWAVSWLILAVGFGPGSASTFLTAIFTTLQTALAFVLLAVVLRQLHAPPGESATPAASSAPAPAHA